MSFIQHHTNASFYTDLSPGNHKKYADEITKVLENNQYTVQRGAFLYITPERCKYMPSCYANNPPSPYGVTLLPKSPNEDTSTYSNWGVTLSGEFNGTFMSATYRLDETETILMLGQTAPRSLYYAYIPYVFDRWYPEGWRSKSSDWSRCADVTDQKGSRCRLFASLGNPTNMLNMNTSNENGESFNSEFAYFMGGDKNQIRKIQAFAIKSKIPRTTFNVFGLSNERANLGLNRDSDGFMHLTRTAFIENKEEFNDFIYNPDKFITILRITPKRPIPRRNREAYPAPVFKQRISEPEAVPSKKLSHEKLTSILSNDMRFGILEKYQDTYRYVYQFPIIPPIYRNGYDCMDQGMQCNGDNQDTLYPNTRNSAPTNHFCMSRLEKDCPITYRTTLQEDGSDFFIITGVNHNATKRSLYSSISAYSQDRLESLGGFDSLPTDISPKSYWGSAKQYLKNADVSDYFFAVKISRKCEKNEKYCLEIKKSGSNSLPLNQSCVFIERSYLDKMQAGPTNEAHVKPIIYHFSSKYSISSGGNTIYATQQTKTSLQFFAMLFIQFFMAFYFVE